MDQLENKDIRILIPGAGRGYEAIYLYENGFKNVFVCDWAEAAFTTLKQQCPSFPTDQLLITDFFQINDSFDLMIEQTFFCALPPDERNRYVEKSAELINSEGLIVGLLFASHFNRPGPPFGGTKEEYIQQFSPIFQVEQMEIAPNSILPRLGNELFFKMKPKQNNK